MDMAIGLGKILGFELSENFNLPYLSKSIQEFWNRWHITLSKWLQDTLLFPFQFKTRRKQPKWLFAILGILITFLVSGLWHGNSWNFVLWGLWHGVWLCLEMLFLKKWLSKLPGIFQQIYALLIVNLGWVFFRLDSLKDIGRYFSVLFIPQTYSGVLQHRLIEFTRIDMLIVLGVGILVSFGVFKKYSTWMANKSWLFEAGYVALLFVLLGFSFMQLYNGDYQPFLYAEF
jgi:alginate O-acetyltransferase complex protein AlgI